MKADILMPKLGESITEGTIVKWWKQPGESVKKDETLLEISTDKVDSEIPSPYEGVIVELKAGENDTVAEDSVIAVIDTEAAAGESKPSAPSKSPAEEKPAPPPAAAPSAPNDGAAGSAVIDFEMPKLGESITEGTIVKWWKQPGDAVKKDETIVEISTDKVDSEIPSPYAGVVKELLAGEGDTVEVGSVIARLQSGAGAADAPAAPASAPAAASAKAASAPTATASQSANASAPAESASVPRQKGGKFYSPLVRSIARKENISPAELEQIPGSGLEGRVTKQDVLGYLESGRVAPKPAAPPSAPSTRPASAPTSAPAAPATPPPSAAEVSARWEGQRVDVIPMDNIRKKIADHMVQSKHTSPHVYGVAECDFSHALGLVKKHRETFQKRDGMKLTINPMILYAVAKAINDYPDINSSIEGHTVIRKHFVNIGMAVATERGLIVPTLKHADEMNFIGVARRAFDLAIRARDRKLDVEDVQGATFTVTNYGVFGNVIGFPIINQPNVAILGVGAIKKRPVVIETEAGDVLGIRSIGYMTLSYDHRLVDGELGDRFLQQVVTYLENFDESWL